MKKPTKKFNPFSLITQEDVKKYSGKTISVNLNNGDILKSADSYKELMIEMEEFLNTDVIYGVLTLPK